MTFGPKEMAGTLENPATKRTQLQGYIAEACGLLSVLDGGTRLAARYNAVVGSAPGESADVANAPASHGWFSSHASRKDSG